MAITQPQDVLHSVVVDLSTELVDVFSKGHPAVEAILKGSKDEGLESHEKAFDVMIGDPATSVKVATGGEMLTSQRKRISRQATERPSRVVLLYEVPNRELARTGKKKDMVRIFDKYPKATMIGARERFVRQFIRGASSAGNDPSGDYGFSGQVTLNADMTYSPDTASGYTARRGILGYTGRVARPDAGAGQTYTIHGLPMEDATTDPTNGWYHQYGDISSMGTDGRRVINTVLQRANFQGEGENGVDIMMADEATFQNLVDNLEQIAWINNDLVSVSTKATKRRGIKFGDIPLYHEPEIDIADTTCYTTSAPQDGLLIGLSLDAWKMFFANGHSAQATNGNFEAMAPILLQDRDSYQYRLVCDFNLYCNDLRRQMVVTGGAQE